MKDQLQARLSALQAQRAQKAREFAGFLAHLDAQITASQTLLDNWDAYTVDEALAALAQTGVRLRLES